jgi:hypothetical protein
LQADLVGPLTVGEGGCFEVEAVVGQWPERVGELKVEKVFGGLSVAELWFSMGSPPVGLGAQVFDLGDGKIGAQEGRHVGREGGRGETVDDAMAIASPGEC